MANGRYVNFQLTTPFLIDDGDEEDFEVIADVIDGAGDTIEFYVERALDVAGFDDTYGYGLNVDVSNYTAQSFDILAGDLVFVNHPIPDQMRYGKDDVVLMEFHIDVDGGSNLLLEDIIFDVYAQTIGASCLPGGTEVADSDNTGGTEVLRNIQLHDVTNGGSYNLSVGSAAGGDSCHVEVYDNGLGLNLIGNGGDHLFQLIADVADSNDFTNAEYAALTSAVPEPEFYVELRPNSSDVHIEENTNGVQVTNITPSFLVSSAIDLGDSQLEIDQLNGGTSETVVNGAYGIELLSFEIDTDDVSPIYFDEIQVSGAGTCAANFNDNHVSIIQLYRGVFPNGTLLDSETVNGNGPVDFDNFSPVLVPASSTQPMYVTIDLIDDNANIGNCI